RWRAPEAPRPWQGARYVKDSAPACLQNAYGWQDAMAAASSEDCLYLEVRTPDPRAALPVMVFIHGGANRAGGGTGTIDAGFAPKGVVIVSIQYRLGVFGFLSHPALTEEQGGASGNYALMDQAQALKWVRHNIAAFGGDPDNVTLFGHSAGAQDVGLLLASPLAKGLFHKAISESGPPQFGLPPRTLQQNEALGVDLAKLYSMNAVPDSAEALADLRRAPAVTLQQAADKLPVPIEDASFIWLQAVVDGKVLPRAPEDVFRAGEAARVPLIIGVSAQELGLYGGKDAVYPAVFKAFGADRFKAMRFYRIDTGNKVKADPILGDIAMQVSTDIMMRCPADWTAAHMAAAGNHVWLYQLSVNHGGGPVHHGSELNFVMNPRPEGQGDATWPPLLDYWVRFAENGDPNEPGLPDWPAYGAVRAYIDFTPKGPYARTELRGAVCALRDTP
ncbi:MAG: carboxylesterase family protein, partial [Asticcacaulis sp.]|nr:carboxylesterase family protein [Asticcacaulis sp.]